MNENILIVGKSGSGKTECAIDYLRDNPGYILIDEAGDNIGALPGILSNNINFIATASEHNLLIYKGNLDNGRIGKVILTELIDGEYVTTDITEEWK